VCAARNNVWSHREKKIQEKTRKGNRTKDWGVPIKFLELPETGEIARGKFLDRPDRKSYEDLVNKEGKEKYNGRG